ncbi:hypothetical protein Tco_0393342 [Tanacetum coccineum]
MLLGKRLLSTKGSKSNFSYDILDLKSNTQIGHEWDENTILFSRLSKPSKAKHCQVICQCVQGLKLKAEGPLQTGAENYWSERNDYQKQLKSETQRLIAAHCVVQLVCDEDAILG